MTGNSFHINHFFGIIPDKNLLVSYLETIRINIDQLTAIRVEKMVMKGGRRIVDNMARIDGQLAHDPLAGEQGADLADETRRGAGEAGEALDMFGNRLR